MMTVEVKESTMVRPVLQDTPHKLLWSSNGDLLQRNVRVMSIYLYKPNGSSNFFDARVLKEALSKVLVTFYPWAGRLRLDEDGRIEIKCNGEGVLFLEADSTSVIDNLDDFTPITKLNGLLPTIDYSGDVSSYPLVVLQVTRFKCGGVCLGMIMDHCVGDGTSMIHFINSWSEITRGIDISVPPFINRTLLRTRDPPTPAFQHVEYQPPPPIKTSPLQSTSSISMLKITRDQLHILKSKCKSKEEEEEEGANKGNYSSYEVLAGHLWRRLCQARGHPVDQETKIYIPVDGRSRLRPPLPPGYLGNVVFNATPIIMAGEIMNNPLTYAVGRIHDVLTRIDDEYLRSALDYLEVHPIASVIMPEADPLWINSWLRMPIYDADFGWGRPIFVAPWCPFEVPISFVLLLPSATNDGSILLATYLQPEHAKLFQKILYEF